MNRKEIENLRQMAKHDLMREECYLNASQPELAKAMSNLIMRLVYFQEELADVYGHRYQYYDIGLILENIERAYKLFKERAKTYNEQIARCKDKYQAERNAWNLTPDPIKPQMK